MDKLDKIVLKIRNTNLSEDDVLKYGRILITEFAKDYHAEQLAINGVVLHNEQLNDVNKPCAKEECGLGRCKEHCGKCKYIV